MYTYVYTYMYTYVYTYVYIYIYIYIYRFDPILPGHGEPDPDHLRVGPGGFSPEGDLGGSSVGNAIFTMG